MSEAFASMVYGHNLVANSLLQMVTSQHTPQALLITGAPQVGKTTLAQAFALAINCPAGNSPCGHCQVCRKIQNHNHPDVILFDSVAESITIEQVRELQHALALKPVESRYKIAIFSQFERATLPAANALLKTLEEPPRHVILILTAQQATNLLPTIVSRCQVINLKPIPRPIIAQALQDNWGASPAQSDLLSRLAAGRLGWAVNALAEPDLLARREQYLADLSELIRSDNAFRLAYANATARTTDSMQDLLNLWLSWWRDLLLLKNGAPDDVINIDQLENLSVLGEQLGLNQILNALHHTFDALKNLNYNVNMRLNFEVLLLRLPYFRFGD
jgi:DNA polymerase-3 subunit delta'